CPPVSAVGPGQSSAGRKRSRLEKLKRPHEKTGQAPLIQERSAGGPHMRLTLRTLLAYLDDTLDAREIKEIGEKVAESDAAQELWARRRQVTRRRRLTVPPATGPEGTDPNDVAEYLDNELAADRVSELEKTALESDVHLAEIAACHQILTLVLGEPALV